jgi:hypothetical protein
VRKAKDDSEADGLRAHQFHLVPSEADRQLSPATRQQRDALEAELFTLRNKKDSMNEEAYLLALERIARQLAKLYQAAEADEDDS